MLLQALEIIEWLQTIVTLVMSFAGGAPKLTYHACVVGVTSWTRNYWWLTEQRVLDNFVYWWRNSICLQALATAFCDPICIPSRR